MSNQNIPQQQRPSCFTHSIRRCIVGRLALTGCICTWPSAPLFQVLVNRLGHLKHVQFLTAKDRLQFVVGQYFSFVLWILKFVLLNVRPNLFCDFASRQWFGANNFGEVL
jgi:hypothetical protein